MTQMCTPTVMLAKFSLRGVVMDSNSGEEASISGLVQSQLADATRRS